MAYTKITVIRGRLDKCLRYAANEEKTYLETAVDYALDRDKTEIVYNGDWFRKMTYEEVLKLNARVTMQQMLAREDFKARVESGKEVRLHEIQYPIMQGWDSVEIRADVELGGTDQLFNILVGRDLQKEQGMLPQIAMTMPLLEGLDGVLSQTLQDKIWEMIWKRWCAYEDFCHSR